MKLFEKCAIAAFFVAYVWALGNLWQAQRQLAHALHASNASLCKGLQRDVAKLPEGCFDEEVRAIMRADAEALDRLAAQPRQGKP